MPTKGLENRGLRHDREAREQGQNPESFGASKETHEFNDQTSAQKQEALDTIAAVDTLKEEKTVIPSARGGDAVAPLATLEEKKKLLMEYLGDEALDTDKADEASDLQDMVNEVEEKSVEDEILG